jgi:protein-tyrosine-phosphatase
MAEGILKDLLSPEALAHAEILSAGTGAVPGLPASAYSVSVCEEEGIDISGHRSRPLTPYLLDETDLVLTMEAHHREQAARLHPEAAERIHVLGVYAAGGEDAPGIPDPIGSDRDTYRRVYEGIHRQVQDALPRIEREILADRVES